MICRIFGRRKRREEELRRQLLEEIRTNPDWDLFPWEIERRERERAEKSLREQQERAIADAQRRREQQEYLEEVRRLDRAKPKEHFIARNALNEIVYAYGPRVVDRNGDGLDDSRYGTWDSPGGWAGNEGWGS